LTITSDRPVAEPADLAAAKVYLPIQASWKPAGLAAPLIPDALGPGRSLTIPSAQQAAYLDPWADAIVSYAVAHRGGAGDPSYVIGDIQPGQYFSLGWGKDNEPDKGHGYIQVDMGQTEEEWVCNGPGADLRIHELNVAGDSNEGFFIYVWNPYVGNLRLENQATHNAIRFHTDPPNEYVDIDLGSFINSPTGNKRAFRYVKIESQGNHTQNTGNTAGPDIAAVEALNMCAVTIQPPVINTPVEGSQLTSNGVTVSGGAGQNVWIDIY
jgi:hypothetical protein